MQIDPRCSAKCIPNSAEFRPPSRLPLPGTLCPSRELQTDTHTLQVKNAPQHAIHRVQSHTYTALNSYTNGGDRLPTLVLWQRKLKLKSASNSKVTSIQV